VRINSEGKKLNQSDFIMTLMSVFWDDGRTELESFCRAARNPGLAGQASPFNQLFQPDPDHLLRVDVGVAFRRARLEHVYSLLRGKNLSTDESSADLRKQQHLKKLGVESIRDINQIANYALLEWDDNIAISDAPPATYWPAYSKRFTKQELAQMCEWHALPPGWWELTYNDFLAQRRPLIAQVVKAGYLKLVGQAA